MRKIINIVPGPNDLLVIVDMQRDFVTGVLGTPQAKAIVPTLVNFVKNFKGRKIYTRDTHHDNYLSTQEGQNLPVPHCIDGTDGHRLIPELEAALCFDDTVINKDIFGSRQLMDEITRHHYDNIYFVGVCTGICVISNAIMARSTDPETRIHVISNLCACVSEESHETALNAMELCQIDILEAA